MVNTDRRSPIAGVAASAAVADAYRRGAEAMREAAAKRIEGGSFLYDESPAAKLAKEAAAAIRALPMPEEDSDDTYDDSNDDSARGGSPGAGGACKQP